MHQDRGQRCRLSCSTTRGRDRAGEASAPQNDSRESHLVRAALHPPPGGYGSTGLRAALNRPRFESTNVRRLKRLRKVRWLPRVQGRGGGDTTRTSQRWRSESDRSAVFAGFRFIQDRQTGGPSAVEPFRCTSTPQPHLKFPPLLLDLTAPPCDQSECATIPSSFKDRSKVSRWVELEEKRGSETQIMMHKQDCIEQLKKEQKRKTEKEKKKNIEYL